MRYQTAARGWLRRLRGHWPDIVPNVISRRADVGRIGLRTRMTVLVIVGTVLPIGLVAYLGNAALAENTQRTLQDRVVLAQTTARHIDYVVASIENVLTDAASQSGWPYPGPSSVMLGEAFQRLEFFGPRLFLLDSTGNSIEAIPPISSTISFSNFASVNAVLGGQAFAVSRYKRPIGSLDASTVAAAPVRDSAGRVAGALVLSIDLAGPNVRTFADPIGLGRTGYMDLVDLGGVILASTNSSRVGLIGDHGQVLANLIQERRDSVSTCHNCHTSPPAPSLQRQVLAFAPLERAQWGVAVLQSEDEVLAAAHELQTRFLVLIAVLLAGALILIFLTNRNVINPIRELTKATERIAAGDLDTPIQVQGQDEIGGLARSFDAMRVRVSAWNRELDTRVQQRTSDLSKAADKISRLYAELQQKEILRRQLLYRVISVQEEERKRISRELHDETTQILVSLAYSLDNLGEMLEHGALFPSEIKPLLENMRALAKTGRDGVSRIILDLRPTMLDHLGLIPALRWYADTRLTGNGLFFSLREEGNIRRLPPAVETALFRVAQEAINNIARHSGAHRADLLFEYLDDRIQVSIEDDGRGFDPADGINPADGKRGLGLIGMEERMSAVGGEFHLRSAPGAGTTVTLSVPLKGDDNVGDSSPSRG